MLCKRSLQKDSQYQYTDTTPMKTSVLMTSTDTTQTITNYPPQPVHFTMVHSINGKKNWFVYVNNNPVNATDPFGLSASERNSAADARSMEVIANLSGSGDIVYAERDGVVFRSGFQNPQDVNSGMGWRTSINTEDGYYDQHGHLDPASTLAPNTRVQAGDPVGRIANLSNGHTTGPHDHVERRDFSGGANNQVDPGTNSPFAGPSDITSGFGAQEAGLRDSPHTGVDHVPVRPLIIPGGVQGRDGGNTL